MTVALPTTGRTQRPPKGAHAYVCAPEGNDASDCVWYLVELGYKVSGPPNSQATGEKRIREGVAMVLNADFLVLIPGHEFSRHANIEVAVARALHLPLLDCGTLDIMWTP